MIPRIRPVVHETTFSFGIPVTLSTYALVPGRIPKLRYRRVRGQAVALRWRRAHGTRAGRVPGSMMVYGRLIVHPDIWPALKDKVHQMTQIADEVTLTNAERRRKNPYGFCNVPLPRFLGGPA